MTLLSKLCKASCLTIFLIFSLCSVGYAENSDAMVNEVIGNKNKEIKDTEQQSKEDEKKQAKQDEQSSLTSTESTSSTFSFMDFIRMIAAFIFVLALLYFLLKFINKKTRAYQKGSYIKNLGGTNLGNNKSIQLVKIGNSVYIVGVGDDVQLLGEIENEDEIASLMESFNGQTETTSVTAKFSKTLNKYGEKQSDNSTFMTHFKKQLEEMSNSRKKLSDEVQKKVKSDNE